MTPEIKVGDIVDITIKGARVVRTGQDDLGRRFIEYAHGEYNAAATVDRDDPSVTVEHVAPAEWPPQPGDVWRQEDNLGRATWFAQRYFPDFDDKRDCEGCNAEGWRIVFVPLDGGPYGTVEAKPEDLVRKSRLVLVHREQAEANAPQDGGQ